MNISINFELINKKKLGEIPCCVEFLNNYIIIHYKLSHYFIIKYIGFVFEKIGG